MRFNRGKFNRSPFNRPKGTKFYQQVDFTGSSEIGLSCSVVIDSALNIVSVGDFVDDGALQIYNQVEYSGFGIFDVLDYKIEKLLLAAFNGSSDASVKEQLVMFAQALSMLSASELKAMGAIKIHDVLNILGGGRLEIPDYIVQIPKVLHVSSESFMSAFIGALIFIALSFSGSSQLKTEENLDLYEGFNIGGFGDMPPVSANQYYFDSFKELGGAQMSCEGVHNQNATVLFNAGSRMLSSYMAIQYDEIQVNITLNPSDVLIIDTCNYTATLNGENVLEELSINNGTWIKLSRESIELITDAIGTSELDVKVDYTPRWK